MTQVRRWKASTTPAAPRRPSRLRIVMPSLMLMLFGGLVCVFWLFASWRTGRELEAWLDREAALGREWTCPDRRIGGFPFRIEVSCDKPTFRGAAENRMVAGDIGRVLAVAQVYSPNHVIVEADGPLTLRDETGAQASLAWDALRASVVGKPGSGLERISIEATTPTLTTNTVAGALDLGARGVELHLRRAPDKPQAEGAYDVAATLNGARLPPLDAWLGGHEATNASLVATLTKAEPLGGRRLPEELDRWRQAGGRLQLTNLTLLRGAKRVDATGNLGIDELHRAQGRVEVTLAGLDELLASLGVSSRTATIGGLLAGVLGGGKRPPEGEAAPGTTAAVKGITLPLRLDNGKAFLGPIPVAQLVPLY